jgi:hypothetical protein
VGEGREKRVNYDRGTKEYMHENRIMKPIKNSKKH